MNGVFAATFPPHFLREDGRRTATANERLLLSLLRRDGPQTRAELSRSTGLTAHSITRLIDPLIGRRLVLEDIPVVTGPGKPGAPLRLNGQAAFGVGVSIMTDAVALALIDLNGAVLHHRDAPLRSVELAPGINQIRAMIDQAIAEIRLDPKLMVGVGVAVTGYFIGEGAKVNPPSQLDPWALQPLDQILSQAFAVPVWIENDGSAAAVGEAALGVGRHVRNFAYLYFSAGFGGGVIVDGALARGRNGNAGEFASILPDGWFQPNLQRLLQLMAEGGAAYPNLNAMLADFAMDRPGVSPWLDEAEASLNLVISAISATLDPDLIVLGGRLPRPLADQLALRLRFTNPLRRGRTRPTPVLVPSATIGDASAIGAATLPIGAAFFNS